MEKQSRPKDYNRLLTTIIEEAAKADLEVKFLDHLVYGQEAFAFPTIRSVSRRAKDSVVIVAGQHGNEYWSVDCLLHSLGELDKDRWNLYIFPCANPWGWSHSSRLTGDRKGSNLKVGERDTRELRLIFDNTPTKLSLFLDVHGDADESSAYIYERKIPTSNSLARLVLNDVAAYFDIRKTKTVYKETCKSGVVTSYKEGTLEEFYFEKRGALYSLTFEVPGRIAGTGVNQIAGGSRMIVSALNNFDRSKGEGLKPKEKETSVAHEKETQAPAAETSPTGVQSSG
jgi:predicted deacylase